MKSLVVYFAFFAILYLFFKNILVYMRVDMTGWQFIVFIIVLAGGAEFLLRRLRLGGRF